MLPEIPTMAEAGLAAYDRREARLGIVAPAGTPREIIDKLSVEIARVLARPEVHGYVARQGMDPLTSIPGEVAELIKADIAKFARIIRTANIKVEQ